MDLIILLKAVIPSILIIIYGGILCGYLEFFHKKIDGPIHWGLGAASGATAMFVGVIIILLEVGI